MSARLTIALAAALSLADLCVVASKTPTLDYEFFKTKVEPIFLKKREGHTRCYVCHEESTNPFRLEKLPAGAASGLRNSRAISQRPSARQGAAQTWLFPLPVEQASGLAIPAPEGSASDLGQKVAGYNMERPSRVG